MDAATMLSMLKVDLGIVTEAYDARLTQYIQAAAEEITREGASTLDASSSVTDAMLVTQLAAYMWRARDAAPGTGSAAATGMPRWLRYAINNRIFAEKAAIE